MFQHWSHDCTHALSSLFRRERRRSWIWGVGGCQTQGFDLGDHDKDASGRKSQSFLFLGPSGRKKRRAGKSLSEKRDFLLRGRREIRDGGEGGAGRGGGEAGKTERDKIVESSRSDSAPRPPSPPFNHSSVSIHVPVSLSGGGGGSRRHCRIWQLFEVCNVALPISREGEKERGGGERGVRYPSTVTWIVQFFFWEPRVLAALPPTAIPPSLPFYLFPEMGWGGRPLQSTVGSELKWELIIFFNLRTPQHGRGVTAHNAPVSATSSAPGGSVCGSAMR